MMVLLKNKTSGKNNGGTAVDALRLSLIKEMNNGSELSFTFQDTSYISDAHLAEAALECGPTIEKKWRFYERLHILE